MINIKFFSSIFTTICVVAIIFSSCNEQRALSEEDSTSDALNVLLDRGYNENDIQKFDNHFIVEGDIVFTKEELLQSETPNIKKPVFSPEQPKLLAFPALNETLTSSQPSLPIELRQKRYEDSRTISGSKIGNIRVQIHSSLTGWNNLVQQAINAWNNAGSKVNMTLVSSNPDVIIYSDKSNAAPSFHQNLPADACGVARVPNDGKPGRFVTINIDSPFLDTYAKNLANITHELGHVIGLAHTNSTDSRETVIAGTPSSDPNSLMNAGECGRTTGLSNNDIIAIRSLYPKCANSMGEWYYLGGMGWLYNGGNNWFYLDSKKIWISVDVSQNFCSQKFWFQTSGSFCGNTGLFYQYSSEWFYSSSAGRWLSWNDC